MRSATAFRKAVPSVGGDPVSGTDLVVPAVVIVEVCAGGAWVPPRGDRALCAPFGHSRAPRGARPSGPFTSRNMRRRELRRPPGVRRGAPALIKLLNIQRREWVRLHD